MKNTEEEYFKEEVVEEEVEKVEVEEEDYVISDFEEGIDESSTAEEDNSEEEPEVQEESTEIERFRDKSKEDVIKAYRNLEKMAGDHSRELGELRKKISEKEVTAEIPAKELTVADLNIKQVEDILSNISSNIDPLSDNYNADLALQQSLLMKRQDLRLEEMVNSTKAKSDNEKSFNAFKEKFTGLSKDVVDSVREFAKERFSDQFGAISENDLETAFFMSNKELYLQNVKIETENNVRNQISKAGKIASAPTIKVSDSNKRSTHISWEDLYAKDPDKAMKKADEMTPNQLDLLLKKINKRK